MDDVSGGAGDPSPRNMCGKSSSFDAAVRICVVWVQAKLSGGRVENQYLTGMN